jgi:spore photoproduct lyase
MTRFASQKDFRPQHMYIEAGVQHEPFCERIIRHWADVPREIIRDGQNLSADELGRGTLLLARQRGPFLRYCPGTSKHICCMYFNLDVAAGCDLGCRYCILQGYLNTPTTTMYCNTGDLFRELDETLQRHPQQIYRIGTGELSDSMTFDHFTGLSVDLVNYFSRQQNAIIELKSKNVHIENLLGLPHNRRTVVSWSVNAEPICQSEEAEAPVLADRLAAAKEIGQAGYRLGFHFDPMIHFRGWEEYYKETVDRIFTVTRPEDIAWISLGALRYPAAMDDIIRENHPESKMVLGELLPGIDKKMRYFKTIRIEMFSRMNEWIIGHGFQQGLYLCMESDEVWRKAFGWSPGSSAGLKHILDERVRLP